MENPEEILHSLEEFAKMKPKDIPRELEEYLKFVAKTGDPVYQWSAIKSLFREKLINVITEFYESCSSMEIPPCPNVEMFNYDLMKNFILEKLDTFASAPFTLQRICELLTSPRKEYTRIDKYMRALEKNILVVSTMEPGGRRTENGDGVMNGIESDHEHVPEPGNEINVEEMDDSPSWPQNIQTNNHISEPISFDNSEHEYHVSTSNQEIVCVQYVSVERLASEGLQIQSEEVKESDISVTITALNVKKGDENQVESSTPSFESPAADNPKKTAETVNNQEIETEVQTKMDIQVVEPIGTATKDTTKEIANTDIPSDPLSEDISSTTTSEKPSQELEEIQAISLESENAEIESVSPETSVTSSENSPVHDSNASTNTPSNNPDVENTGSTAPKALEEKLESQETSENNEILETNSPGNIDSSTKVSEDHELITKASESNDSEVVIPELESKEPLLVQDTQKAEINTSPSEATFETETDKLSNKVPKIEAPCEAPAQVEQLQTEDAVETISEETSKSIELPMSIPDDILAESKSEEVLLMQEEKETPMEIDVVPENTSDSDEKDKPTTKEPEMSDPPV